MVQKTFQILKKAIHRNDIHTFRSNLQTANNLYLDYQDYELLIKALHFARKRITNILLDNGCRAVKLTITNGCTTPLHIVVSRIGWSTIMKKLLTRGARVDVCDENGDTPIHIAFLNGAAGSVIDFLLKYYIEKTLVDTVDKDGLGLLHIACTRPYLNFIRAFVDIGGSNVFSQVRFYFLYRMYNPRFFQKICKINFYFIGVFANQLVICRLFATSFCR